MKRTSALMSVVASLVVLSPSLWAATEEPFQKRSTGSWKFTSPAEPEWPWRLYAGVAAGYGSVAGSEFSKAPRGTKVLVGFTFSFQPSRWVLDAGLGWLYSQDSGIDSLNRTVDLRTRMGVLDLSARARIGRKWQLGPAFKLGYGTDTSFAPSVASENTLNAFGGARLVFEERIGKFPVRFYTEGLVDLSIRERRAMLALAGIQFGLPVGVERRIEDALLTQTAVPVEAPQPEIRVVLDPKKIFFDRMSAQIMPEVKGLLTEIGEYLAENEATWGEVEIAGHADRRGKFEYNLELSRKRAEAVRDVLRGKGTSPDRLRVEAFSYLQPADLGTGPSAWARNRRVEIVIRGVKEPWALSERINRLSKFGAETPSEEE